jgi:dephospho-CoA kinase
MMQEPIVSMPHSIPTPDRPLSNAGKPIIGIIGGIGSGKSFVASLFAELGALVIDSDKLVHVAYQRPDVKQTLLDWWGKAVFHPDGSVNRKAIASRVFTDENERKKLENLIHPLVNAHRDRLMDEAQADDGVRAFVWDTPLLVETGLHKLCDAVVFVDSPLETRLDRVKKRGWDASELSRREKSQLPLDKKRKVSDYCISNAADAEAARSQVRLIFSRIKPKNVVN